MLIDEVCTQWGTFCASAVRLERAGESDIVATNVTLYDDGTLTFDLDLTGAALGTWAFQRACERLAHGDRAGRARPLDGGAVPRLPDNVVDPTGLRAGKGRLGACAVPDEDVARMVSSYYSGYGGALVSDRDGTRRGKKGRGRRRYRSSEPSSRRHLSGTGGRSRPVMTRRNTIGGATASRASRTAGALSEECRNGLANVTL